jgi:hypothetical protein
MFYLPKEVTDADILAAVRYWVELLAGDRYEEAHAMMLANGHWTPDLMRTVIRHYGFIEPRSDGRTFTVSPIFQTTGGCTKPYQDIERFADGDGIIHFDLPLNGEWSDVTAIIEIKELREGLALRLADIHVL